MAIVPAASPGRVLYWLPNGTLGNATVSDLLDLITASGPTANKYYLDVTDVSGGLVAITATGSLAPIAVVGYQAASAALVALAGTGSLGGLTVSGGSAAQAVLEAVSGTGSLGGVTVTTSAARRIALVSAGNNKSFYSDTAGAGWTQNSNLVLSTASGLPYRMAYGGGRFVVPAGGTSAASQVCWASTDGVSWSYAGTAMPSSQRWAAVAWNGAAFCAVAYSVSKGSVAATSPDGLTWTARTLPGATDYWYSIVAHGSRFVAMATSSSRVAVSDDNGATWTNYATLPGSLVPWRDLASNGSRLVAVSSNSTTPAATSDDGGASWTARTVPNSGTCGDTVAWNGSVFCTAKATKSYCSTDGVTWIENAATGMSTYHSVVVASGTRFLCWAASAPSASIYYSDDGASWSAAASLPSGYLLSGGST